MMYLIQKASLTVQYEIRYSHCNFLCNAFTSVHGHICVHAFWGVCRGDHIQFE